MTIQTLVRSVTRLLLAVSHCYVLAALPILTLVLANAAKFPLDRGLPSALCAAFIAVTLALMASRGFGGSLEARAAWLGAVLILFGSYGTIFNLVAPSRLSEWSRHPVIAAAYTLASMLVALAVRRPWDRSERRATALTLLSLGMLAAAIVPFAVAANAMRSGNWRGAADAQIASVLTDVAVKNTSPDIYVIVLDGMGREDVLKEKYGVDLSRVRSMFESQGFVNPRKARSPYAQTMLTLAAILNMGPLDTVAAAVAPDSESRYPLAYLLRNNALMQLARRAGYRVIDVGSEFSSTAELGMEALTTPDGLSEMQDTAMRMTPLTALPLERWSVSGHRRNVEAQFAALRRLASDHDPRPKFVFAHILAPHPPFVFEEHGASRLPPYGWLTILDGDHYPGSDDEYRAGYAGQAAFIAMQMQDVAQNIASEPGRDAAVMITGDHGPGSELYWEDAVATNMTERMSIFSAYRFPGVPPERLYPSISPVNAARILANTYFGTKLPPLSDRSAFSTWKRPYDFIPLPPEAAP